MTPAEAKVWGVSKRDHTVRAIAHAWRELTGGTAKGRDLSRRTLIACSAGADSSALALALAAAAPSEVLVIAHVVHDMRSPTESFADRDAAKSLADRLGLPFVEGQAKARSLKGNAEAAARKLRYAALEQLAIEHHCPYIAIAHHAGDQLETMLMALVRGAGPRGLAGIPKSRKSGSVQIIRPALGIAPESMRALCRAAGWTWREDATNLDESRLRAAIRHRIVPELERLRPGAAKRAARSAELLRGAAKLVRTRVKELLASAGAGEYNWKRSDLRREPAVILGDLIKLAASKLTSTRGQDQMSSSAVSKVVRAIRDSSTEPRTFHLGGAVINITARSVTIGAHRE